MDDVNNTNAAPVAIIGFGAAGFNAAVALRRAGYRGAIDIFSNLGTLPYSPILTSYYAAGMVDYEDCFPWSQEEVDALDADIHMDSQVERLDITGHKVICASGEHEYSKCIIATGASPSTAGFPAHGRYKPLVLHSMEDAERLKDVLCDVDCRRMLVSGASMVALKAVEACLARGKDVTLVGMNPHVLDFNALPAAAERFERGLRHKGVSLRLGQTIRSIEVDFCGSDALPEEQHVIEATFSDGSKETFDEIVVAHGMKGNLGFLEDGSLKVDAGILVDEHMRTSDADVYAAGDVAQATELISDTKRIVGIWKNAAVQGACAGIAVAEELAGGTPREDSAFEGSISTNTIAVNGTLFISAGTIDPGPDGSIEVVEDETMTVAYVYRRRDLDASPQLVGFNITSDVDEKGGIAYDTGAMLTLRILEGLRA